ncbi:acyl-homoserine-lactone synthase [Gluconacetobacter sacchari]|uniref:Acyl-homoserine-lactone synthase n=2 Tax=Gluconacetobacter sacchari TaxID=92759 RepID=A0A7W4IGW3_9PROT|nr:acyl-homoserine-lactone synthase [Gluconacetobacter sacchari]MBB2162559.1 autoinducer synthase [Gluconacetobacter sacchari]GBQ31146.1 N-acyl-L-homoserine lactone synthetase [Gluconacetobacter sacchari DSM 12717]
MIDLLTLETAHYMGTALRDQYRFRYKQFVMREKWDVPSYRGMEYDQFDTPAAAYLVWRDDEGSVRGLVRLLPTIRPYMTESLWPELIPDTGAPRSPDIWENTRFGVDGDLPAAVRKQVSAELIVASIEFALSQQISAYLIVSPRAVLDRTLPRAGLRPEVQKSAVLASGHAVSSAYVQVSEDVLVAVRRRLGLTHAILRHYEQEQRHAA